MSVTDPGPGIAPGDAEHIFDPFYSTKGGGLGVGLSICRAIIEAHGGRLSLTPNAGGGCIFQFTLPVAKRRAGRHDVALILQCGYRSPIRRASAAGA